jgi:hypothetical protein
MIRTVQDINRRVGAIVGAMVFLISFIVYLATVAPTTSYWDCGEFISCSLTLGVMHPPGAPLYLLIGRLLTMLPFFGDIGLRVNVFSVFVSAATILLTFLIIVQLIRKWRGTPSSWEDRLILYSSGVLGALAFAFTDSFWFNAVEAEVYSFSMFFTALVVWLALAWGERSEKTGNLLFIFFIFYLFGLAAGVHLLNILAFPFVLAIAYFHENQVVKRLLLLFFFQALVPLGLYVLLYSFNPAGMSYQDLVAHQNKAWAFMRWFGALWVVGSLVYIFFKDRRVFKVWWIIPILFLLGYSTYIAIYIRAGLSPPINMNDPSTLDGMKYYLGRKQYGEQSLMLTFFHRQADFWRYQIQMMYTRYFGWQFIGKGVLLDGRNRIVETVSLRGLYGLPFIVGLWGAVHHFFRDWKRALAVLIIFFLMGYGIIIYLNQPDPQPRERDYSYVGSFFAFAIWIGTGMAGILEGIRDGLRRRQKLKRVALVGVSLLLCIVPLKLLAFNYHSHDRSGNYVAWDYSYNILQTCEPNAIIFTGGDNDTYPLWYLQVVEGIRTDVRVVCLALMNSHWYLRQLRDQEPRVPVNLNDEAIERIRPIMWKKNKVKIPVPEEVRRREMEELRARFESGDERQMPDSITFTLEPTWPPGNPRTLRMQDLMVVRILQVNRWQRPVYFALTVMDRDQIGLNPYLRMDGLALKVMPYPVEDIDEQLLRTNVLEKYRYRGLTDSDVYFNIDAVRLLSNVRQTYLSLARHYLNQGQQEDALFILDEMSKRIVPEVIPYADERLALSVVDHYRRAGRLKGYEENLTCVLPGRALNRRDRLNLARVYTQIYRDWSRAEEKYRSLIQENPEDMEAYSGLLQVFAWSQQFQKGITLLENWLSRHPGDKQAQSELERFRKMAVSDTSAGIAPETQIRSRDGSED